MSTKYTEVYHRFEEYDIRTYYYISRLRVRKRWKKGKIHIIK